VPADDKENARILVSQILLDELKSLEMSYPATDETRRKELQALRELLVNPADNGE
jgi:hypothetical protein